MLVNVYVNIIFSASAVICCLLLWWVFSSSSTIIYPRNCCVPCCSNSQQQPLRLQTINILCIWVIHQIALGHFYSRFLKNQMKQLSFLSTVWLVPIVVVAIMVVLTSITVVLKKEESINKIDQISRVIIALSVMSYCTCYTIPYCSCQSSIYKIVADNLSMPSY